MPPAEPDFDDGFNFETDQPRATRPDADSDSPTLRRYHQLLWSKPLRSGNVFALEAPATRREGYLIYTDASGDQHWFGSDAITNSYTGWLRPKALVDSIAALSSEQKTRYLNPPYTVGSTMIWLVRPKDRPTINQARGTRSAIADRMDLTLECIRRHYQGQEDSPLADVLAAYEDFFALFEGFDEFVTFFHFQDLVTPDYEKVRFYVPLEDFARTGTPRTVDEYVTCMEATLSLIKQRQRRMRAWIANTAS
ncbi:hypothetical protein N798_00180 [Knoellia flava TL1]|uniref:Uncharacterized protein n=2 Tax=Knoellia flava TaxID=913969 RepID=A0A8H9KSW2_9MICO|nr:hypothetical protein [Knoellia flava]KGN36001.1 hypothetical protein N798_00180 [Knoellia flava TL1]GGB81479.1 hypothetical protein GCM10011314_21360 [Knoellia flava]